MKRSAKKQTESKPVTSCSFEPILPLSLWIRGSIILKIWWQLAFILIYTMILLACHFYVDGIQFSAPNFLIQLLGVVCGLLLVFRTNTAYDRYWEGRRTWSTLTQGIRVLTRCFWVNVKEESASDLIDKRSGINLLLAFAYATKHHLRGEYSYDEEDLKYLTRHISHIYMPCQDHGESTTEPTTTASAAPPSPTPMDSLQPNSNNLNLHDQQQQRRRHRGGRPSRLTQRSRKFRCHEIETPSNIPLEISYHIASYMNWLRIKERADFGTQMAMSVALNSIVECLTTFERILRTPIPLAYSVHLHQSVWLYLLALPFQLAAGMGWWTILVVLITAFFFLGVLQIGWEIENPFGSDDNDLPLDDFCRVLKHEIQLIVGQPCLDPPEWIFTDENHPFSPDSDLNAIVLSQKSIDELREIVVNR